MKNFFFLLTLLTLSPAFAEDSVRIVKWTATGSGCNKSNVELIQSGNTLAFLTSNLGVSLDASEREDHLVSTKACTLTVIFDSPARTCVTGIDQLVSGGILKSPHSRGSLAHFTWLDGVFRKRNLAWHWGNTIHPEDEDSLVSYTDRISLPRCTSARRHVYTTQLHFFAQRKNYSEHFLAAIDSLDGEFFLRLRVR
jgi:hypothetical protein